MSYIDLINEFWSRTYWNPCSAGQTALFFAILDVSNKNRWAEWVPINFRLIASRIGMTSAGVSKAKDVLIERGFIDVVEENKKCKVKILLSNQSVSK